MNEYISRKDENNVFLNLYTCWLTLFEHLFEFLSKGKTTTVAGDAY